MARSVSAEKLVILECRGGTLVTVYAAGSVKSGGITGFTFDSTKGEPNVGCSGELLRGLLAAAYAVDGKCLTRADSGPSPTRSDLGPWLRWNNQDSPWGSLTKVQASHIVLRRSFRTTFCVAPFERLVNRGSLRQMSARTGLAEAVELLERDRHRIAFLSGGLEKTCYRAGLFVGCS